MRVPSARERHRVAAVHDVAHELAAWRRAGRPGWKTRKSSAVKPRLSSSAIASASPSASCISDDVVGARLCGQASRACGSVSTTSAAWPSALSGIGGDGDEPDAEAARIVDQVLELDRLARPRQRQDHVVGGDHAEVAVARLAGMDEERGRAGRGEGRRDLAADMAGLAHAGDDHPAARPRGSGRPRPRTAGRGRRGSPPRAHRSRSLSASSVRRADRIRLRPRSSSVPSRRAMFGLVIGISGHPVRRDRSSSMERGTETPPAAPPPRARPWGLNRALTIAVLSPLTIGAAIAAPRGCARVWSCSRIASSRPSASAC